MRRRFGVSVDPFKELHPLLGSKEGIAHLATAILNPGDAAIVPVPGYAVYHGGTVLADAEPYIYDLTPRTDFLLELDEIPADVLKRARLVYLNYPNNPTAAVAPREYLERTIAACRRHDIVLAYDNPYCEITFDGYVAPSIFEIPGAMDVAVEFHSLSKSFCMTGWRLGWAVGRADRIAALARVKNYVDTGAFLAVQAAGAEVLKQAEQIAAGYAAQFKERRDAIVPVLRANGFEIDPPRATLYLWIPLPEGLPSAAFQKRALEDVGVVTLPGSAFGAGAEGFFRIALTVPVPGSSRQRSGWERCLPLFDRQVGQTPIGRAWLITAALHVVAVILFFAVNWQAPWRRADYVVLQPIEAGDSMVFVPGTREVRAKGPTIVSSRHEPAPPPATPPPAVTPPIDTGVTLPAYDPNASRVALAPQVGDGRLWVSPRPGLPAAVAEAIYGDTAGRRVGAIDRLRVMVDSLNQVLDQMQRDRQRPKWTVGGTPDKPEWGSIRPISMSPA